MTNCSVLLVEDEMPARTVFRQMIERRQDLFRLVSEAEDGQEGLECYRSFKPQLIVTDITMPGMSGLEMLKQIQDDGESMPQAVILTCHQDFQFAQKAIQLKAAAYLIKDDCLSDPELLTRTMEELTREALSQMVTREKRLQLEQKVRAGEVEIEQSLFLQMLQDSTAETRWLQGLENVGIPVRDGPFNALMLEFDRNSLRFAIEQAEEWKLWQFAGVNVLQELANTVGPNKVVALDKGRFMAIYATEGDPVASLPTQAAELFSANLKMDVFVLQCRFDRGLDVTTGILKRFSFAPYPFFYNKNTAAPADQWETLLSSRPVPDNQVRFWSQHLKQALLDGMSRDALEDERKSFSRQAEEQHWDPEHIKMIYLRVFLELSGSFPEAQGKSELESDYRKKMEQIQTFAAAHDITCSFFLRLRELQGYGSKIDSSISKIVNRIREDLNYPYKLEEAAASINYSVPYFSSMFKKATGESFIQYLTRQRLERAKLLLRTTDLKTFEIAEAIGFENYRSFNRIFKKETGYSPSDFRRYRE
ncbi:response regulator transcription factor [Gorillibacterium timonense]|uniref:response regulator transcription factor n=1 Tax=Gorillibacterium timonense TaxID=1689269 RepID=UPI00071D70F4|nr:helix-turn-helix domain-containing protein [Gorillibacterium timonense]